MKIHNEIKKIVDRIVENYKPEKIVLFGSFANGKPTEDSDIDLFIIKKTKKNLLERIREVDRILINRTIPLDVLVYTPKQTRERLNLGDFFVEDIMNNGKVLYEK
ncbi:nucleotidyltransferase domain-containing protein [Patescibacteria group bacterium]|nr:nucleotidyltransferase domain-containing protein [Patescibacteria group bacterium]